MDSHVIDSLSPTAVESAEELSSTENSQETLSPKSYSRALPQHQHKETAETQMRIWLPVTKLWNSSLPICSLYTRSTLVDTAIFFSLKPVCLRLSLPFQILGQYSESIELPILALLSRRVTYTVV